MEQQKMKSSNILRVLTYHRIANPELVLPACPRLVSATPEMFSRHMSWLSKHYNVVDMPTAIDAVVYGRALPRKAVLITFDDAYPDFLQHAWPVLRKHQLPATLFVPTAFPDQQDISFWWDRLYAALTTSGKPEIVDLNLGRLPLNTPHEIEHSFDTLQYHAKSLAHNEAMAWIDEHCKRMTNRQIISPATLGWKELELLSESGVSVCAHSRTHPLMTRITNEQVHEEIAGSQHDIAERLGKTLPVFCYPAGAYNQTTCNIAKAAGIVLGFSTRPGINNLASCDPLGLRRINVTRRTTPMVLRGKLSRIGNHAYSWRHNLRQRLRRH